MEEYSQQKWQYKKCLFFFYFLYITGLNVKMDLISVEGYAKVIYLKNKNGDLCVIMKGVGNGLGVKNISELVLKEIHGAYEKRINKRRN